VWGREPGGVSQCGVPQLYCSWIVPLGVTPTLPLDLPACVREGKEGERE
jgi:hypothetical protein